MSSSFFLQDWQRMTWKTSNHSWLKLSDPQLSHPPLGTSSAMPHLYIITSELNVICLQSLKAVVFLLFFFFLSSINPHNSNFTKLNLIEFRYAYAQDYVLPDTNVDRREYVQWRFKKALNNDDSAALVNKIHNMIGMKSHSTCQQEEAAEWRH